MEENFSVKKKARLSDYQIRKTRRRIWQEDEVHKLIYVWGTRLEDLRQSKKNRHIYEEISEELNQMGLDTIREEVHIKIQNLSQLYRNEKRRTEATAEAPTWLYYYEVDQLLGSHQDNTMDSTTLDESSLAENANSEVVSIGDSGSEREEKILRPEPIQQTYKNGFEALAAHTAMEYANAFLSRNSNASQSSTSQQITSTFAIQGGDAEMKAEHQVPEESLPQDIQSQILGELRKANATAEREQAESRAMHQELRSLEEQRFKMTQMFIERSLTLQRQMLECLRSNRRLESGALRASAGSVPNGGLNESLSPASDSPFKIFPKQQSSRPQFVLSKKKK